MTSRSRILVLSLICAAVVAVVLALTRSSTTAPSIDAVDRELAAPIARATTETTAPLELPADGAIAVRANPAELSPDQAPAESLVAGSTHPALAIRGRVVTPDGAGIDGADVALPRLVVTEPYQSFGSEDEPVGRTRSTPDGTFVLEVLAPAGPFGGGDVVAGIQGHAARERGFAIPEGRREVDVGDLVLVRGATLRGTVRDRDGAPIADARVEAQARDEGGTLRNTARSGANGSFEIVDAPSGRVEVTARLDDGRRSVDSPTVEVASGGILAGIELVVPIYADPLAILGVVLDVDGAPLAGATVIPTFEKVNGDVTFARLARTDARGKFRVQGLAGARFRLIAEHPRGAAVAAHAEDVEPGRHDVVLRLTVAQSATLRVRDTRGNPVERFAFRVRVQDGPVTRDGVQGELADHSGGEVALALPGTTFSVAVTAPGHASAEIGPFEPAALPAILEVGLETLPAVRGRVVRRGEPVLGATVSARADIERSRYVEREGFALVAEACRGCPETKTDADGTFVLDVGRAGDWWICAEHSGLSAALAGPFTVAANTSAPDLVLDLAPRGAIEGRVRHANGRAIPDREVRASCGEGKLYLARTDENGAYRFELAPGSWQVRLRELELKDSGSVDSRFVRESDVPPIVWDCRVTDGASARFDIVVPEPSRLVVRIAATAASVADASWNVRASRERRTGMPELVEARAGERSGEHVLALPTGGEWRVSAGCEAHGMQLNLVRTLSVPPGESDLAWSVPDGSVRGRLRPDFAANTRIQLAGRLTDGTAVSAAIGVAADGAFEFPFAITGRYGLVIDGNRDRRTIVTATAGQSVDAGEF